MKTALARDATLSNTPGYVKAMSGPVGQLMVGRLIRILFPTHLPIFRSIPS